jgi:hypothetical protein
MSLSLSVRERTKQCANQIGGAPKLLAEFETDRIFGFDRSRDGKYLACVRGLLETNVVLIEDFR